MIQSKYQAKVSLLAHEQLSTPIKEEFKQKRIKRHPSNIHKSVKGRRERLCIKKLFHKNHTKLLGERFIVTKCNRPTPIRFCQMTWKWNSAFFNLKTKTTGKYLNIKILKSTHVMETTESNITVEPNIMRQLRWTRTDHSWNCRTR